MNQIAYTYRSADATAVPKHRYLSSLKCRMVLRFRYWLTQVVAEKRPSNGCFIDDDMTNGSSFTWSHSSLQSSEDVASAAAIVQTEQDV